MHWRVSDRTKNQGKDTVMTIRKDNTPFRLRKAGGGIGIATCCAWLAGLALAALVVLPPALFGAVIDDFDAAEPAWDGWNPPTAPSDPAALAELASKRLRLTTAFTTPTDPAEPMDHSCDVYYETDLPVQQGRTLELRAYLVNVGPVNIFASLAATEAAGGKYMLLWGRTEVALLKWSQNAGFSVAFWETHSSAFHDLVLALALTPEGDDLLIETKVSRRSDGEAVYQRAVRDTPASDWGVPDPLPHGWQILGPDPGAAHKGDVKIVGLGMLHDTDGQQATAIVQFDTLEYRTFVPPKATFVIDDFEHGRKFLLSGTGCEPEWEFVGGQLKLSHVEAQAFTTLGYCCLFELSEGQPIEFSLDWISANLDDACVYLPVSFAGQVFPKSPDQGYELFVLRNRVGLAKFSGDISGAFFDLNTPLGTDPKTISITLTREGANLRIGCKVVLRDDPQQVLFSKEVTDHPGSDSFAWGDDPGPPPSGPGHVSFGFQRVNSGWGEEVVVDNLLCSQDPMPKVLAIRRRGTSEAELALPRLNIALESDSLEGPWRPCPEPLAPGAGEYVSTVPLGDSVRYFRMVEGWPVFDSFDSDEDWQTASVIPGDTVRPNWYPLYSQSRGRILGVGARNADFTLRPWPTYSVVSYRDCVATVDISDWGAAMEDATFGILLRVKPEGGEMWFSSTDGLPDQRYAGLLTFKKADNPTESALSITGPGGELLREQRFAAVEPDKQYRLRFGAVGDQLTLELFDRDNLNAPIQTMDVTDGRVPVGMDALYGTKSAGGTYEVWIDQYIANGAVVY